MIYRPPIVGWVGRVQQAGHFHLPWLIFSGHFFLATNHAWTRSTIPYACTVPEL